MPVPISPDTAHRIRELAALHPDAPLDQIARWAEVALYHVRHVLRGDPLIDEAAEIHFREVEVYRCPGCERKVCLRPCPACEARRHKADAVSRAKAPEGATP